MLHGRIRTLCACAKSVRIGQSKFLLETSGVRASACVLVQKRGKKDEANLSTLFKPVVVKPSPDDINVGTELTGSVNKVDLLKLINRFYQMKEVKRQLAENGLDRKYISVAL